MPRNPVVPGYIYSAAQGTEHLEYFERQYLKYVDRYDDNIGLDADRKEIGRKIGYAYFSALNHNREKFCAPETPPKLTALGDEGFVWKFLEGSLNEDSVVYCAGMGTNISFETALAAEVGCVVHCFDPTPQAAEYVVPIARKNEKLCFHAIGLFSIDGVTRFYKPPEPYLGSLSATNITYSDISIDAPVLRVGTVMRNLKHDHIDLLKIDIEGAEHGVIEDVLFAGLDVRQLCVEFDMPVPPWKVEATMRRLYVAGFELVDVWALNCLFVRRGD